MLISTWELDFGEIQRIEIYSSLKTQESDGFASFNHSEIDLRFNVLTEY